MRLFFAMLLLLSGSCCFAQDYLNTTMAQARQRLGDSCTVEKTDKQDWLLKCNGLYHFLSFKQMTEAQKDTGQYTCGYEAMEIAASDLTAFKKQLKKRYPDFGKKIDKEGVVIPPIPTVHYTADSTTTYEEAQLVQGISYVFSGIEMQIAQTDARGIKSDKLCLVTFLLLPDFMR